MSLLDQLNSKLVQFIRSYYLQRILNGVGLLLLIGLSMYLIFSGLEYQFYFSKAIRGFMFWATALIILGILIFKVLVPFYHLFSYKHRLSRIEASKIIGSHFPEIKDKLLNVLQLSDIPDSSSNELLIASIEQKINEIRYIQFTKAIDWQRTKRAFRWVTIPSIFLILIWMIYPAILSEGTHRIVSYDQHFAPKAPFEFKILNSNLTAIENQPLTIRAKLVGKELPKELSIYYGKRIINMNINANNEYEGTIDHVQSSTPSFRLKSLEYISESYKIDIVAQPMLIEMEVTVSPPAYTGQRPYTQKDIGDINAPKGSHVKWSLMTKAIDHATLNFDNQRIQASASSFGFTASHQLRASTPYTILLHNNRLAKTDTLTYSINLLGDMAPSITVKEFIDSFNQLYYYAGDLSDDYGLSSLKLVIQHTTGNKIISTRYPISISKSKNQTFQTRLQPYLEKYPKGTKLTYYWEVYDNDPIDGPKVARSQSFNYNIPSMQQLEKNLDAQSESIKGELAQAIKETKDIQNKVEQLRKKMLEKKQVDYNDKQLLKELMDKQNELKSKIEKSQKELQKLFEEKKKIAPQDPEITEKQKQLDDLMKQVNNPEVQKMMEEMAKMMEQIDKKEVMKNLDKMEEKSQDLKKDLDRMLNLYKNLDYQQKMNQALDKMEKLAEEQERMSKETNLNRNTDQKQQEAIEKNKEIQKELDKLNELHKEITKQDNKDLSDTKSMLDEAEKMQQEALDQKDQKEAAKKQKEASEKIKEAKDKLKQSQNKKKKQRKKEDAATIRRLLQNIIHLSFEQESILETSKKTKIQSPYYPTIAQKQRKLKDDFAMVEDSLYALATRQAEVKKPIFDEIKNINNFTDQSIEHLAERRTNQALVSQQFALNSYNQLALMLSESLRKMNDNDDDQEGSDGNASCDNPKKSKKNKKPSAAKLSELQQQLNQQLEELMKQIQEKGKKEGKKGDDGKKGNEGNPKDGGQGTNGQNGKGQNGQGGDEQSISEQIAKIAAQQAAIRNALKQLDNSSNQPDKSGKKPLGNGLEDVMQKMEQTEKDLVNKRIYNEMLLRQKEIEIKLLEASKAEREQDEEQKRESQSAKFSQPAIPESLKKYLQEKQNSENQNQKKSINLSPFYQKLVDKYYELIK